MLDPKAYIATVCRIAISGNQIAPHFVNETGADWRAGKLAVGKVIRHSLRDLSSRDYNLPGKGLGLRSSPMATKVKIACVTFCVSSPNRSRRQASTLILMDVRPVAMMCP